MIAAQAPRAQRLALADDVIGNVARALWVLFGALGIVLLVACANVAALMLARMEARQNELAVRAALGAGRGRIVRALLVESTLLAVVGGALGFALAAGSIDLLVAYGPATLPRLHEIAVDGRAFGFAAAASVLSGTTPSSVSTSPSQRTKWSPASKVVAMPAIVPSASIAAASVASPVPGRAVAVPSRSQRIA